MKNKILVLLWSVFVAVSVSSCSEESLSSESVVKVDETVKNDFDKWLAKNYVQPYNIDFKYRMEDIESDLNYYLIPAEYNKSVQVAKLVRHLCLQAYDEVAGPEFMKMHFPKMIHLIGSAAYNNNGTMVLGTAEGGLKITLYYVNSIDPTNIEQLNRYYFRTIHHEFGHIMHQKKPYPVDFEKISADYYVGDSWNSIPDSTAYKLGFVSPYSSKEPNEDFVEILASYITHTDAEWQTMLTRASRPLYGTEITNYKKLTRSGDKVLKEKFEMVYNYFKNTWNIDLTQLRTVILRRSGEVSTMDLDTLN